LKSDFRTKLIQAIQGRNKLQLGYRRRDGTMSLHIVAPIDLQLGVTADTQTTEYLWAYCFAEGRAEARVCDGILTVRVLDERFDADAVKSAWPSTWPLPPRWRVDRDW
jgi:predicted DNA-binding transcriptional regulator YafY